MLLLNKKVLIFDLDGCLLDTSSGIRESVNHTLQTLGLGLKTDSELNKFIGPPIQTSLINFCHLSIDEAQRGADLFREYYKNKALWKAELYSGISEVLTELRNLGFLLAVATYKREDYAITLLKEFDLFDSFDIIHGGDNNNQLSKKDIIQLCLNDLNFTSNQSIMIGDTLNDAKGASELHMDFIGVTWGFGFKPFEKSISYPSLDMIDSPDQLIDLLKV